MNSPVIVPPLAGRVLGSATDNFVIAEWQDAGAVPGSPGWIAPLHLHRSDDEAWYVLEGRLSVKKGEEEVELRAGSAILVPRGTPHTYRNPAPHPVRYLLIMRPRIHRLIQEIHATPRTDTVDPARDISEVRFGIACLNRKRFRLARWSGRVVFVHLEE